MPLTEPQLILLGVLAVVIIVALIACWVLSTSEPRFCRICERLEIVEPGASSPGWYENNLCMECATLKAALNEGFRYRLPRAKEVRNDGHR
jgi:hypothetical protein